MSGLHEVLWLHLPLSLTVCVCTCVCVHIYDLLQYWDVLVCSGMGAKIQRMCCMKTWLLYYYGEDPSV